MREQVVGIDLLNRDPQFLFLSVLRDHHLVLAVCNGVLADLAYHEIRDRISRLRLGHGGCLFDRLPVACHEGEERGSRNLHRHLLGFGRDLERPGAALHPFGDEVTESEHVFDPLLAARLLEVLGDFHPLEAVDADVGAGDDTRFRECVLLVQAHDLQVGVVIALVLLDHAGVTAVLHVKEAVFGADREIRDGMHLRFSSTCACADGINFGVRGTPDEGVHVPQRLPLRVVCEEAVGGIAEHPVKREKPIFSVPYDQTRTDLLDGDGVEFDLAIILCEGLDQCVLAGGARREAEVVLAGGLQDLAVFRNLVSTRGTLGFGYVVGVAQMMIHVYLLGFAQSAWVNKVRMGRTTHILFILYTKYINCQVYFDF